MFPLSGSGERSLQEPGLALLSLPTAPAIVVQDPPVCSCPAWVAFRGQGFSWCDLQTRDKFSFIFTSRLSLCALFQATKS